MKKVLLSIIFLVLCVACIFSLSACGQQNNDAVIDNTPEESVTGDSNILVAYFSWSGNTQQDADWISDKTGG